MLLVDHQIRHFSQDPIWLSNHKPLIAPFSEAVSGDGIISYGLTSAGYDLRLAGEILMFKNSFGAVVDPKMFKTKDYEHQIFDKIEHPSQDGYNVIIPAHSYALTRSFEYLALPRNMKGHCLGKSTYARCGLLVNTTPLEPGWEGYLTIELSNISPCPIRIHILEGIAQLEFHTFPQDPEKSYDQKQGKYQGQIGVTPARVI